MGYRERTLDSRQEVIGSVTDGSGNVLGYQSGLLGVLRKCNDTIGNRTGFNNLYVDYQSTQGGLLSGIRRYWATGQPDRYYNDLPVSALSQSMLDPSDHFTLTSLDINAYGLRVLAKTNPANSEVNVPQFLAELKDLPGMVKTWGDYFKPRNVSKAKDLASLPYTGAKGIANATLSWKWGLAPLISDLRKLLKFQELVEARFKTLDRLRKGETLRKRVNLDHGSKKVKSGRFVVQSWQVLFDGYWDDHLTHEVWGTVQWYTPNWSGLAKATDRELMARAKSTVAGMNSRSATMALWELVPWSWLADWFSNVGDIIAACGNSTDLQFQGLCIMQHMTATRQLRHNYLHWYDYELELQPLVVHREKKYRFANVFPIAFPSLRLPVLTNSQLSIVGSLGVLRIPQWFKGVLQSR